LKFIYLFIYFEIYLFGWELLIVIDSFSNLGIGVKSTPKKKSTVQKVEKDFFADWDNDGIEEKEDDYNAEKTNKSKESSSEKDETLSER
jgi:hypothetical protein